jgi:hypothetical protein
MMTDHRPANLLLVALLLGVTLFSAYVEGYWSLIALPFWLSLAAGFAVAAWLALTISTRRLLALILGIFMIEYLKETIGIRSGMWIYHGINGSYLIGVWAWVLAGLVTFTLATRVAARLIRKLAPTLPRALNLLNPVLVVLIFLIIPLTLGPYRPGAGAWFWGFYAAVFLVSLVTSLRLDFPVFLGLVLVTWLMGNLSEYVGSVPNHLWTFPHNPNYPPFFLVMGCWPLEILSQYALSAFWADERLDLYTF